MSQGHPTDDTIKAMRAAYDEAVSGWANALEDVMSSESFVDMSSQLLQHYLTMQSTLRQASATAAAELHLPSLDDIGRLSTLIINLERKVDEIADHTRSIDERLARIESRLDDSPDSDG